MKFSEAPGFILDHTAPAAVFCRVPAKSHRVPDKGLVDSQGYLGILQASRNKAQHSLHGNTKISLEALLPVSTPPRQVLLLSPLLADHTPQCTSSSSYDRDLMLRFRPTHREPKPPHNLPRTTPLLQGFAQSKSTYSRTGRRRKILDSLGQFHIYQKPKNRNKKKNSRINGIQHKLKKLRTPPPRGTPGAPSGASEECPQPGEGTNATPRGAKLRRSCRRAYRKWRRECKQQGNQRADSSFFPPPKSTEAAPTRTTWFRNAIYWQEDLPRKRKPTAERKKTTPPLAYNYKLRVGAQNVQGMADTLKLKNLILMMSEHSLDVVLLSETKATNYYSYTSEQHLVILSGNNREKHAGVGAIIHPRIRPHLADVVQVNNRIIHLIFNKKGGRIHVLGCYAPHSGLDLDAVRQPFWDTLETYVSKLPQPEPVYLTGDFNVRFQAHHPNDDGVTGPFTYGKGRLHIDHTASSNRSMCVQTMQLLDMAEVASYRTPNPVHHITYRDKTAPPVDWSQYVLDPLILQQVYTKMHQTLGTGALAVASHVRSFLEVDQPLPPKQLDPQPDPTRFQRLDHTFTRTQWLSSVNSCRSKLHCGFPSDHYLLVTELQVKLAARTPKQPRAPKLNFSAVDHTARYQYNQTLQCIFKGPQRPPEARNTPESNPIVIYTDGSGSKGKATRSTKAGWGWCSLSGEEWIQASGPVVTDQKALHYHGATVGSNNTGEVTAIIEALEYAHTHDHTAVHIFSDSEWAINVIRGRWRAKANRNLVNHAQRLVAQTGLKVHFQWVKSHQGTQGNEIADRLANRGRDTQLRQGDHSAMIPILPLEQTAPPPTAAENIAQAMQQAAKETFQYKERHNAKPWIKDSTVRLLEQARAAQSTQAEGWKQKRNQAKRAARRDRVEWIHQQLTSDPNATHSPLWNVVKRQKKGFQGKKTHLIVDNKPVPWSKTHEAFKTHLEEKQWAEPQIPDHTAEPRKARPHLRPTAPEEPPFTLQDLHAAMARLKKHKAPGPDGLVNELILLLDREGELDLLRLFNQCWLSGDFPESWAQAFVVSIYKGKGADTDPSNYRPISLLNALYKLYAAMLQATIASQAEPYLRESQYGFRAQRGTRHPLFAVRRAMEWSEMTGHPLYMLFLDWKQAFDSIDHTAMIEALDRFGLSDRMLLAIMSIYDKPEFTTRGNNDQTATGKVSAGIRQGCPLSPYLFIIVLTVILHDMDNTLKQQGVPTNTWSEGYPVSDLEYADDTLLLARTIPQLQSILSALEHHAAEYGMHLNTIKTEFLLHPDRPEPKLLFADQTVVPTTEQVKYLGSIITWKKPFEAAFKQRCGLAEEGYKKLRLVWNSSLGQRTKLQIFQSTFVPILTYGLDALTLTTPLLKRIDAFYYRFLRRVVGIKASYYSRITNLEVWHKARDPKLPSETLHKLQLTMMREVFTQPRTDITHSVVFGSAFKDRILSQGRRRGMQFPYWIEVMCKRYFPKEFAQDHTALGPHFKYSVISKLMREPFFGLAPKRANTRARP